MLSAHPTNGHLCTEINRPARCFNTDGFCEWVLDQCLYRCDLHNSQLDCEQIKDGCGWTDGVCVQTPGGLDLGMMFDANAPNELDSSLNIADDGLTDVQLRVLDAGSIDRTPRNPVDATLVDAGGSGPSLAQASCHSGANSVLQQWFVFGLLLLLIRTRPC